MTARLPSDDQAARDAAQASRPSGPQIPGRDAPDRELNLAPTPQPRFGDSPTPAQAVGIPGNYHVWRIAGQWYIVFLDEVPGVDTSPIAYSITPDQANVLGVRLIPEEDLTALQFAARGGQHLGSAVTFLNNPDVRPFDGLVRTFERALPVMPWLADPEVFAVFQIAALEGRDPEEWEFAGTQWWRSRTEAERDAVRLAAQDPSTYRQRTEDNRLAWEQALRDAGVAGDNVTAMAHAIADRVTRGTWSPTYADRQLRLLADPFLEGDLDPALSRAGLSGTRERELQVQDTMLRWLGPVYGQPTGDFAKRWASRLRQDPEGGMIDLETELARQRLGLFPEHTNPELTYEDIAQPVRNLWQREWGSLADETSPLFGTLMRTPDLGGRGRGLLLRAGLDAGVPLVVGNAAVDFATSLGGGQVR